MGIITSKALFFLFIVSIASQKYSLFNQNQPGFIYYCITRINYISKNLDIIYKLWYYFISDGESRIVKVY
jgi:hypothetical protein